VRRGIPVRQHFMRPVSQIASRKELTEKERRRQIAHSRSRIIRKLQPVLEELYSTVTSQDISEPEVDRAFGLALIRIRMLADLGSERMVKNFEELWGAYRSGVGKGEEVGRGSVTPAPVTIDTLCQSMLEDIEKAGEDAITV
jgi:hypothetical protein